MESGFGPGDKHLANFQVTAKYQSFYLTKTAQPHLTTFESEGKTAARGSKAA
jgi:hypothetical protein